MTEKKQEHKLICVFMSFRITVEITPMVAAVVNWRGAIFFPSHRHLERGKDPMPPQ